MYRNVAGTAWVVPLMRAGYLARGLVYALIGFLALHAAWTATRAEEPDRALVSLLDTSVGPTLLWSIVGGAFCFAIWSVMAAVMDLDGRGTDLRGIFARIDFALTGLLYIALGLLIADLAANGLAAEGEAREESAAWLLSLPAGGWAVIAVGAGFIAAGAWFGYKAFAGIYRERLIDTPMVRRLDPVCKFGWTAYGVVIVILGSFLIWTGWTLDPSRAGGFAEAFSLIQRSVLGPILLPVVGAGFVAFAVECVVEAVYRFVPKAEDGDPSATRAAGR